MKIDMSPAAITIRLRQVNQLRRTCLALAQSSIALKIRQRCDSNKTVRRTSHAFGR